MTLRKSFGPVMLMGKFSVRIVTTRTRGRAHGRRDDSIDCDSDIRGRLRAIPMGYEPRPLQDQQVEERIGQALQLKPVISENSIWLRMIGADACSPALARNVRRRAARDWIFFCASVRLRQNAYTSQKLGLNFCLTLTLRLMGGGNHALHYESICLGLPVGTPARVCLGTLYQNRIAPAVRLKGHSA